MPHKDPETRRAYAREVASRRRRIDREQREQAMLEAVAARPVLDPTELAWAAGLMEGEGTFTISGGPQSRYTRPVVTLTMTDEWIVRWFDERWPGNIRRVDPGGNGRSALMWSLNSRMRIELFLADIGPYVRSPRVAAKVQLLREDLVARRQGSRTPGYWEACHERRERMRVLNSRGRS